MGDKTYIAIDLKSFYASVECVERGLNPLDTNLVVADASRTDKTICLAVSPSLKSYGIGGRARLFEVKSKVKEINRNRLNKAYNHQFFEKSIYNSELIKNNECELDYVIAPPRMAFYIEYSTKIYNVYLKYISEEDIHVYSIDEVFMDVTSYLKTYNMSAKELAQMIIKDVLETTGITATAGIGTNLYLCKIAMDIVAKHKEADEFGVRIAELNELTYRQLLWEHQPITDFWRVGAGYANRLANLGLYTMGDVALCSIGKSNEYYNEDLLYKTFGKNAELLIDHAWGYEPCEIKDIKSYKPMAKSLGSGQVLHEPYSYDKAKLITKEMLELLILDLTSKNLVTNQLVLTIGYDIENVNDSFKGDVVVDYYGRKTPKHAHGTANLKIYTEAASMINDAVIKLYERIVDKNLLVRRINISANNLKYKEMVKEQVVVEQLDLFSTNTETIDYKKIAKEEKIQETLVNIKNKYGKNSVLKGMNLEEGATTIDRNKQIGGHKA